MSSSPNRHQRNNTSGLPGMRLNRRRGYLVIDVTWMRADGRRGSTSYLVKDGALEATRRALAKRRREAGVRYQLTPRQAWERLKRGAGITRG